MGHIINYNYNGNKEKIQAIAVCLFLFRIFSIMSYMGNFLRLREVANGMLFCQRQKCITEILACVL